MTTIRVGESGTFAAVTEASAWTEEELVARMIASNPTAWREFSRRYDRLIDRCIMKVTRRFSSVVTQEDVAEIAATLKLSLLANDMHKLRTFDKNRGHRFSSWMGLLAINCAYDYLRTVRREPAKAAVSDAFDIVCETPDPYEAVAQRERASIAARMLDGFSARDRAFASLYFAEGMDPVEIAAKMNISVKTVYSKKHKIQARLEAALSQLAA